MSRNGFDCSAPAQVTRVKARSPGFEPIPPSEWRERLRSLARWVLYGLGALILAGAGVGVVALAI